MQPAPGRGPSPMLPLAYLVSASAAFALAALALPWLAPELSGHYYQPRILALTHTVTLGWITLTIMGASYQIVPIVLGRAIWSERLARWQLVAMLIGITGIVGHFAIAHWSGFLWSAAFVAGGVAAHLVNVTLTVRGLRPWTFTARLVVLANAGLASTAVYGTLLAVDKLVDVLPGDVFSNVYAHAHLALLGFVLPMVIGVAARVYPMFLLAPEPHGRLAHVQLWGLAIGVPATVAGILAHRALLVAGALAVAAAVVGHLAWLGGMVRGRKRPALDWGLRFVLVGGLALVPASAIGLALALELGSGPRVALAYGALVLGGWASLTIAGMLLKILPFLVWYRAYAPRAGRERVPSLPDLGWPAGERLACGLLVGGFAALAAALASGEVLWIRVAATLVAAGATAFVATLVRMLHHLMPCARAAVVPAAPRAGTA